MAMAKELFDAGQLQAAIEEITREVKANPTDMARRAFLFGLLCFAGEWDRAEKQLDVMGHQDARTDIGARIYRQNIAAERKREQALMGKDKAMLEIRVIDFESPAPVTTPPAA